MEITPSLANYLMAAKIPLRLACVMETDWPIVLSLWYLFEEGSLFCATPKSAKVVTYLRANPRCSFEVASDLPPYCGVRGRALAAIDTRRGWEILERLLLRYLGGLDNKLAENLLGRSDPEVAIRLQPQSLFTWNFSQRMADLLPNGKEKICPE